MSGLIFGGGGRRVGNNVGDWGEWMRGRRNKRCTGGTRGIRAERKTMNGANRSRRAADERHLRSGSALRLRPGGTMWTITKSPRALRGCYSLARSLARTCLKVPELAVALAAFPCCFHRWLGCNYRRIQKRQREDARKKSGLSACVCVCVCVVTPAQCAWACIMRAIEIKQGQKRVQRSPAVLWASALKASPAAHSLFLSSPRLSDCQHLLFFFSSSLSISPSPPASRFSFPPHRLLSSLSLSVIAAAVETNITRIPLISSLIQKNKTNQ